MKYIIKTPFGLVAGFSSAHSCVQIAGTLDRAKLFPSKKAAEKFLAKYTYAGYGFKSEYAEIILVP